MFCNKCGSQLPENTKYCPACGAQQAWMQNEPTRQQPQQYQQQQYQQQPRYQQDPYQQQYQQDPYQQQYQQPVYGQASAPTSDYTKMGGWLLFFMILCILDAVVGIFGAIGSQVEVGEYSGLLEISGYGWLNGAIIFETIVAIAGAAVELYFVYLVFTRNPMFLKVFQILKIAMSAILLILVIMIASSGLGASGVGSVAGSIAGLFIMTAYYCKSVRVRTYMGSPEYLNRALFKIGA